LTFQEGDRILDDDKLTTEYTFSPPSYIQYRVARYTLNGTYLGISNVTDGRLQLCSDTTSRLNAAYTFGTYYEQSVSVEDVKKYVYILHGINTYVKHSSMKKIHIPEKISYGQIFLFKVLQICCKMK
jgi:hypothetical protein